MPIKKVAPRAAKKGAPVAAPSFRTRRRGKGLRMRINAATGEVHVRHMAEVVGGSLVEMGGCELDSTQLGDKGAPVWIQIARIGKFAGHSAGPFELSESTFSDIVKNFKATSNQRVAIDFEHASEQDAASGSIPHTGAPAQGWILDLQNRATDGLWALVEWLEPAREYVRSGKYKFFSPAIRFNARDRVSGKPIGARLTSGALTNSPFLDGMLPLVARDFDDEPEADEDLLDVVEDMIDQALDARETEESTDGEESSEPIDDGETNMADKELVVQLGEEKTRSAELSLKLTASETEVVSLKNENTALKAEQVKRDDAEREAEVEAVILAYKDTKGTRPEQRAEMLTLLKAAPEAFRKIYPKITVATQHMLRDLSGSGDRKEASPSHVTEEVVSMASLADKFRAEGKSNELATTMAFKEYNRLIRDSK